VPFVWTAPDGLPTVAAAVFATCVAVMLGTSALYHRVLWPPRARRLMRRADHAAIYLLIAGTYTPVGLLVLEGAWRWTVLSIVWAGAAVAIALKLAWVDAPPWVAAAIGLALGWAGVAAVPSILGEIGLAGTLLLGVGGALYTVGAVIYARRRPDPVPHVFGYHEVFHALVIGAALCQYAAIAFFVLPS
jgi:hemolysin III